MKKVLTIAGSDCSGGAGLQADLKTFAAHGVYGMSVVVSIVAENPRRVLTVQTVSPELIAAQIEAVFEYCAVDAVKIGMLPTPDTMAVVAEKLHFYRPPIVVVDPVMYAKNGALLMDMDAVDALKEWMLPLADVLTPNSREAVQLAGMDIATVEEMEMAAKKIAELGCRAVVVKGGRSIPNAVDVLFDGRRFERFQTRYIPSSNTHGSGCTFSSALTAQLARGHSLAEAIAAAKRYVTEAIAHAPAIGHGGGPVHHFFRMDSFGVCEGGALQK